MTAKTRKRTELRYIVNKIFIVLVFVVLVAYAISLLFPLLWTVYSSFKDVVEYTLKPFRFTENWRFKNYVEIFDILKVDVKTATQIRPVYLMEMLFNSLIYTTGIGILNIVVPSLTAYVVSKYRFRGRSVIYSIAIITMILPIVGSLPSSLKIMADLHLRNTLVGVWLMLAGGFGFNFLILYGTFNSLSWNYGEAAFIDGASDFLVFRKIMLPLVAPTLSALFILSFIGNWNDYMTPMIYLQNMPTISYGVFQFQFLASSMGYTMPHILAGFVIAMLPIIVIFLIFQDTIMNNVTAGGLKG